MWGLGRGWWRWVLVVFPEVCSCLVVVSMPDTPGGPGTVATGVLSMFEFPL